MANWQDEEWQNNLKRILANHKMSKVNPHPAPDAQADPDSAAAVYHLDDTNVVRLMHCLSMTMAGACTCAETFAMLDQYTELVASDEQAKQLMPLVKNHLEMCPDCREEFEILLKIIHAGYGDEVES